MSVTWKFICLTTMFYTYCHEDYITKPIAIILKRRYHLKIYITSKVSGLYTWDIISLEWLGSLGEMIKWGLDFIARTKTYSRID